MILTTAAVVALPFLSSVVLAKADKKSADMPGAASFVVPSSFPTSVFSSYYFSPAKATAEPQPVLYDTVLNITYPRNLTDPRTIPSATDDPVFYPMPIGNFTNATAEAFIQNAMEEILLIINDTQASNCTKCQAALSIGQMAARIAPQLVPESLELLCVQTGFGSNSSCKTTYAAASFGATWTTVLAYANVSGTDGKYICNVLSSTFCPTVALNPLNTTGLFPKPKPKNAKAPKASGKRVKVLHLSDFHLDARYSLAAEANCSSSMCCRYNKTAALAGAQSVFPAPIYGSYKCDTPYYLGLAALQSIGPLTGTDVKENVFGWSLYTGDLVSHDPENQMSKAYVEYTELSVYSMLKSYIGGPVYCALGNHDSSPENVESPHFLPGPLGEQFSWNYDHVAGLWEENGWIDASTEAEAKLHYAAYSIKNKYGLRVITLNTDFYYKSNFYNFIDTENPDRSGIFSFLIKELQAAEDAGERVWIIGHVLSGWDGTNPLINPSNLFYQIIDRYSPHVISSLFWGHTHEDQIMIYYANNGTVQNSSEALTTGWVGPSITPLTNLNSGYRMYEVDLGDFNVYEAYTFYADVNSFPSLESTGPTYQFEYSTREAYASHISWPSDAPLNATFWHEVTEAMEKNRTLVSIFNHYQGKSSIKSPNCTSDACAAAKVCYMRSGSVPLGRQCPQGFASVQSAYTGKNF